MTKSLWIYFIASLYKDSESSLKSFRSSLKSIFFFQQNSKYSKTLSLVCFWIWTLIFGIESYQTIFNFFNSFFGKLFVIGFIWSYSFQILSEVRHWFWDLGYGFELKTSKITGVLVIILSILITIILYSIRGIFI